MWSLIQLIHYYYPLATFIHGAHHLHLFLIMYYPHLENQEGTPCKYIEYKNIAQMQ